MRPVFHLAVKRSYLGLCHGVHSSPAHIPTGSGTRGAGEDLPRLSPTELLSDLCFSALSSCLAKTATAGECLVNSLGMSRYSVDPSASALSHRGSLTTHSSLYCKRQTSGDGHLGGGLATSPMASGGPLAPGLRPPGSSPKRNGTSLEGNRCGNVMHALAPLGLNLLCLGPGTTAQRGRKGLFEHGNTEKLQVSTSPCMGFAVLSVSL